MFVTLPNLKKVVTMNTLEIGTGPPLLLLHGFSGALGFWVKNLPQLSRRFTIYVIDLLGWGRSTGPKFKVCVRVFSLFLIGSGQDRSRSWGLFRFVVGVLARSVISQRLLPRWSFSRRLHRLRLCDEVSGESKGNASIGAVGLLRLPGVPDRYIDTWEGESRTPRHVHYSYVLSCWDPIWCSSSLVRSLGHNWK